MAEEVELKLALPEEAWNAVARHPRLAAAERLPPRNLVNIYYDTPQFDLRRQGVALRLRQQGRQWLQTVKCAGTLAGGLSTRPEWEYPYDGKAFDFAPIDDPKLRQWLRRDALAKRLQPVFNTTFSRRTWRIATGERSAVLVMFDRGRIEAAGGSLPISELELELAGATVGDLFEVARELATRLPLFPEPRSKAERGYHLCGGTTSPRHSRASTPLDGIRSAIGAFRIIALGCITQLQDSQARLRESGDTDSLEPLQTSLRRLCLSLQLFRPVLPTESLRDLPDRLQALNATLSAAQQWDVIISKVVRPAADALRKDARVHSLLTAVTARGDEARAALVAALNESAFGRLMIDLLALLHCPELENVPLASPTLSDFAVERLDHLLRRTRKTAKHAADLEVEELNALYAAIEILRDAIELLAPIYPRTMVQRDIRCLDRLRADVGAIHDLVYAGPRLARCAGDDSGLREAMATVGAWHLPSYGKRMARLPQEIAALVEHRYAWRR